MPHDREKTHGCGDNPAADPRNKLRNEAKDFNTLSPAALKQHPPQDRDQKWQHTHHMDQSKVLICQFHLKMKKDKLPHTLKEENLPMKKSKNSRKLHYKFQYTSEDTSDSSRCTTHALPRPRVSLLQVNSSKGFAVHSSTSFVPKKAKENIKIRPKRDTLLIKTVNENHRGHGKLIFEEILEDKPTQRMDYKSHNGNTRTGGEPKKLKAYNLPTRKQIKVSKPPRGAPKSYKPQLERLEYIQCRT